MSELASDRIKTASYGGVKNAVSRKGRKFCIRFKARLIKGGGLEILFLSPSTQI